MEVLVIVLVAVSGFITGALFVFQLLQARQTHYRKAAQDFCHLTGEATRMMDTHPGACMVVKTLPDHTAHVKEWMDRVRAAEKLYGESVIGQTPRGS